MVFTREKEHLVSSGNKQGKELDLNISDYTTGGETIDAAGLGMGHDPDEVICTAIGTTLRSFVWDRANKKLLAFDNAGAQLALHNNPGACVRLRALWG